MVAGMVNRTPNLRQRGPDRSANTPTTAYSYAKLGTDVSAAAELQTIGPANFGPSLWLGSSAGVGKGLGPGQSNTAMLGSASSKQPNIA